MTHVRAVASTLVQAVFEKTAAYTFSGKAVESHRLFLFSADLVAESSVTPWSAVPEWHDHGTALVEFMVGQTGPADVLVLRRTLTNLQGEAGRNDQVHAARL